MYSLLKFTIVISFVFGIGYTSNAQLVYGIKTGINVNDIVQTSQDSFNIIPIKETFGYHLGLTVDFDIFKWVSLTSGLTFITKGYALDLEEYNSGPYSYVGKSKVLYNYFEIPLNMTLKKNNFSVSGGPYVGLGTNGRIIDDFIFKIEMQNAIVINRKVDIKAVYGDITLEDQTSFDVYQPTFNGIDLGYNIGVGYMAGPLLINISYSLGLSDNRPTFEDAEMPEDKLTNRTFSFSWTYMMN